MMLLSTALLLNHSCPNARRHMFFFHHPVCHQIMYRCKYIYICICIHTVSTLQCLCRTMFNIHIIAYVCVCMWLFIYIYIDKKYDSWWLHTHRLELGGGKCASMAESPCCKIAIFAVGWLLLSAKLESLPHINKLPCLSFNIAGYPSSVKSQSLGLMAFWHLQNGNPDPISWNTISAPQSPWSPKSTRKDLAGSNRN